MFDIVVVIVLSEPGQGRADSFVLPHQLPEKDWRNYNYIGPFAVKPLIPSLCILSFAVGPLPIKRVGPSGPDESIVTRCHCPEQGPI